MLSASGRCWMLKGAFFTFPVIFVAAALIFCYEIRFLHVKNVNDLVDIGAYVCPIMQLMPLMQLFTSRSQSSSVCLVFRVVSGRRFILWHSCDSF